MNKNGKVNLWHWSGKMMAAVLLAIFLSLFGTNSAVADQGVFASKGFLIDPGGAPSSGTGPYFVGLRWQDPHNYQFAIWDADSNQKFSQYWNAGVGNTDFVSGSAVYFNESVYAFAPYFEDDSTAPSFSNVRVFVIDPSTWTQTKTFSLNFHGIDRPHDMKDGMGAVVANGQIYLFMTGISTGAPVVYSSSDGQNWGQVSTNNYPNYPVVHDAITFIDPKDGKTKVMVVVSRVDASSGNPLLPAVSIFDPATGIWGSAFPLPQGALPLGTYGMHASAWFGSLNMTLPSTPRNTTYIWNSGNTDAYLHVLGSVWTGSMDYLVHWYFNPATGSWIFDPSGCAADLQAVWWAEPCSGLLNRTPAPLGPGYTKTTTNCASGDDCLQLYASMKSCGLNWLLGSDTHIFWSDIWVPTSVWQGKGTTKPGPWTYNTVDTSNPADPAFGNDPNIYMGMAGMIRINGIVMGPPPFPMNPDWKVPADWSDTSNVQLGKSSEISSGTASTFSISAAASIETSVSIPFVHAKDGLSFTYGYSATHSTESTFTSSYAWTLGTVDQELNTLGKQGWMIGHAPVIWPASYIATSVRDPGITGTAMGYSQMMLSIGDAESLFWPFNLTNPSDSSYPMGFLLEGVKPMPASTDIQSWNINSGGTMQDWGDSSKGDWTVIGGPLGIGLFKIGVLNLGSQQVQQFVGSKTTGKTSSNSYTTDASVSLRLGTKGNNVTASMDLSAGYETEGSSSTTMENNMETSYHVPTKIQGGISDMYVQPYLLQANTYNAPWVPKGYKGPLPWAITWDVTYIASSPSSSALGASDLIHASTTEKIYARTPMPDEAYGRITGTAAPNNPSAEAVNLIRIEKPDDTYTIRKGHLSYIGPDESIIPITMMAADFNPSKGIIIAINDYKLYATSAKGAWRRSGDVWSYASRYGTERLNVTLDFGAKIWNMAVSQIELGDKFARVHDTAAVTLDLNGRYVLSTRIVHKMAYEWQADLSSLTQAMEMETINVKHGFSGPGKVTITGRLTDQVRSIGDVSLVLNESRKDYNLMNMPNFIQNVEEKQPIFYQDATGTLAANLGTGHWTITANTDAFPNPRPMHHGEAELKVKIGGKDYFNDYIHPDNYFIILSHQLLN